jgi:hypothetical protein
LNELFLLFLWYDDVAKYDPYPDCPCDGESEEEKEEDEDCDYGPCEVSMCL